MKKYIKQIALCSLIVCFFSLATVFAGEFNFRNPSATPPASNGYPAATEGAQTDFREALGLGKTTAPATGTMLDVNGTLASSKTLYSWANTSVAGYYKTNGLKVETLQGTGDKTLCISPNPGTLRQLVRCP